MSQHNNGFEIEGEKEGNMINRQTERKKDKNVYVWKNTDVISFGAVRKNNSKVGNVQSFTEK